MQNVFNVVLGEDEDNEQHLDVNLDDGLTNGGGGEEGNERNTKVTTSDTSQIKKRVGNGGTEQNGDETILLQVVIDESLGD